MSMLLALLLAQEVLRIGPPDPVLVPADPAAAFAAFRTICVDPFPDTAAFERAVAQQPALVVWRPATAIERIVPGRTWTSPTLRLRYFAVGEGYTDTPRPQCLLDAAVPAGSSPDALFTQFAVALSLGAGKVSGRAAYRTAMWDSDHGGERWRTIFGTERAGDRLKLKLAMMRLGEKK